VPSHLAYDRAVGRLYAADTGNGRLLRLDPRRARKVGELDGPESTAGFHLMAGAELVEIVAAASGELSAPSGLLLDGERLFVSDNATGRLAAYALDGRLISTVDSGLGPGALAGLALGPDRRLYLVDMLGDRALRVDPR
jgi:sugar lactone lactonase YvrE